MAPSTSRSDAERLDRDDPLKSLRDRFDLPTGVVYLDGNSLGALPKTVADRVHRVVTEEWGRDLITSWNVHGWMDLPSRVGGRIAPLIGAAPKEVVCADSTSINVFKLLAAALRLKSDRGIVLSDSGNFPTDLYVAQG
ncbi:MAG: kynureninase, partial [Spirochaetia bacterium]